MLMAIVSVPAFLIVWLMKRPQFLPLAPSAAKLEVME
jgi:hypothetical protein